LVDVMRSGCSHKEIVSSRARQAPQRARRLSRGSFCATWSAAKFFPGRLAMNRSHAVSSTAAHTSPTYRPAVDPGRLPNRLG
jgi:hypothetical protein